MANIDIGLNVDTKGADRAIQGLNTAFKAAAAAAGAVAGAFAFKKVVDAAAVQEQAVKSLNTALALTGEFTEENSKRFQDFASELQKNSTIGDEVSLSLVGLAKSMGATNEQTEKVIQAAADLSAVTGESLETSVRNITKTLGGMKGELGETQPELRAVTAEQLKAGVAIDILSKKYAGAAKALTGTFSGAVKQTTNSFGDLLEEVGFIITQNPLVIEAINLASDVFNKLGQVVSDNRDEIIKWSIDAAANIARAVAVIIDLTGPLAATFLNVGQIISDTLIAGLSGLGLLGVEVFQLLIRSVQTFIEVGLSPALLAVQLLASGLNKLGIIENNTLASIETGILKVQKSLRTSGLEGFIEDFKRFDEAAEEGFDSLADNLGATQKSFSDAAEKANDFATKLENVDVNSRKVSESLKKISEANAGAVSGVAPGTGPVTPTPGLFSGSIRGTSTGEGSGLPPNDPIVIEGVVPSVTDMNFIKEALKPENLLPREKTQDEKDKEKSERERLEKQREDLQRNILSTLGSSIFGGAAGARGAATGIAATVADSQIPGSGAAAGALVDLLMQPSEVVRAQIEAFVKEIPVIIDAIVENIPVLIDAIIDNLDLIIIALVQGVPKFVNAIAIEVPKALALSLKENSPSFWQSFREGFEFELAKIKTQFNTVFDGPLLGLKNIGTTIDNLFDGLFNDLIKPIIEPLQKGLDSLNGVVEDITSTFNTFIDTAASGIGTALKDGVQDLFSGQFLRDIRDRILEIFGIGGEGTPAEVKAKDKFEQVTGIKLGKPKLMAQGGEVPSGFPNDSFPARLTSGENVVDRSTNRKLNEFLDGSGGGTTQVVLQIGEKQLADVLLNLNRQGFRTA